MSQALQEGLYSLLAGSSPAIRSGPRLRQPSTLPWVRYRVVYVTRTEDIAGANVGVTQAGLQLDCMASTYAAARTLADNVRTVLHTYRGAWGSLTCRWCRLQTENDFDVQDGDEVTHWVTQRYQIWTDMN